MKSRTVPFAIQDDLIRAYDAGIARGVWTPTQFNDWGTPVVPIRKPPLPADDKPRIRVYGDYSVTVNPQLAVHRHPLPLPEELTRKLGGYGFTKIDLADAYNQVRLGPESRKCLALSTHRGVLLQNVLPFGISSVPGYFQKIMDDLTSDLLGVAVYFDDILVSGKDARIIITISNDCWIAYMPRVCDARGRSAALHNLKLNTCCCCCCSAYLSSCHRTASDAKLLDDPHTFHFQDYFVIGGIRTSLGVSDDPMFLWISSNSCPLNLLLVRSHQAEIIIVKRLIQGRQQRD